MGMSRRWSTARRALERTAVAALVATAPACGLSVFPSAQVDAADPLPAPARPDAAPPGRDAPAPRPDAPASRADAPAGRDAAPAGRPRDAAEELAPPVLGEQVVINGMPVPRDKVIVFIHIGHSNMAGRTNTPPELRPFNFEPHAQLWSFGPGGFVPAKEPLSGDYLTKGRAGPGMSILHAASALAPDAFMVSIGRGQDGSRGGECKAFRKGGLLYEVVMGPARQLKGKVTFGGIFSMLVLMDIFDKPNLPRAHECTEAVAADMRADLEDPSIPFVMSDWEMGAIGQYEPTRPLPAMAREQLRVAQKNIARSVIVPTDMLPMSDDHHFDLTGYKLWAERALALITQAGWTPWATR
jgi:hypothetical protein